MFHKKFKTRLIPSITVTFTHKWEKTKNKWHNQGWRRKDLGIWFERTISLGKPKTGMAVNEIYTLENSAKVYTVGLRLIVCKFWVSFSFKKAF